MKKNSIEEKKKKMKVTLFVDDPDSWILPFVKAIQKELKNHHHVKVAFKKDQVANGDILFLLGCVSILPKNILKRNTYCI